MTLEVLQTTLLLTEQVSSTYKPQCLTHFSPLGYTQPAMLLTSPLPLPTTLHTCDYSLRPHCASVTYKSNGVFNQLALAVYSQHLLQLTAPPEHRHEHTKQTLLLSV